MSTITADLTMKSVLSQVKDVAEIRDADGNLLGLFTPHTAEESELYKHATKLFDPAELERRKREEAGSGLPLEEVWKNIRAKESVQ